jgi:hypothetical protein
MLSNKIQKVDLDEIKIMENAVTPGALGLACGGNCAGIICGFGCSGF